MTQTTDPGETSTGGTGGTASPRKRGGGLSTMLLADLKALAGDLGVSGAGSMKKAQLVEAIRAAQAGPSRSADEPTKRTTAGPTAGSTAGPTGEPAGASAEPEAGRPQVKTRQRGRAASRAAGPAEPTPEPSSESTSESTRDSASGSTTGSATGSAPVRTTAEARAETPVQTRTETPTETPAEPARTATEADRTDAPSSHDERTDRADRAADRPADQSGDRPGKQRRDQQKNDQPKNDQQKNDQQKNDQQKNDQPKPNQQRNDQPKQDQPKQDQPTDAGDNDGEGEGRRTRRRRGRDRAARAEANQAGQGTQNVQGNQGQGNQNAQGGQGGQGNQGSQGTQRHQREPDTTILDDDVLVPAAGILDVLDNYAFVRTSGYLPGSDDVYLSLSMVRRFGLRRGDALMGQVRQPREGERREKFNPMVRIDTVNGAEPDASRERVDFASLVPVHPTERLRLETGPTNLIGRVIDLAAPIGKGQRALVVSPAEAGKTTVLRSIAAAITANNPECHLMVVLVDERPEEVTDFQREVKGEVIASTFDRPATDHTSVAELAIERAKRLVELGHDVVVLLDGITRLGRAYSHVTPASGRSSSGAIDSSALYPPKRFFGAARATEDGGSLTVLATTAVENGSAMDEAVLEEFTGTDNSRIRLSRELASHHLYPAIDVAASGTRREDLLLGEQELELVRTLRRRLAEHPPAEAHEQLMERLGATGTNIELLGALQRGARR